VPTIYDTHRRRLVPVVIAPELTDNFSEVCVPSSEEQLLPRVWVRHVVDAGAVGCPLDEAARGGMGAA